MTSSTEVTPENFVRAVQMLYHDQDATRKKIASDWLLNVQSSVIKYFIYLLLNYLFSFMHGHLRIN
jgi:hypothetical protein